LSHLYESGLVTSDQMAAVADRLPPTDRGRPVARVLVELGLLTRFQAERLLAGRTKGFRLGQYLILDQLGQGGMGRVYKAIHQTMNRVVAIKVLAPQFVDTARAEQLFLREMQAAARLNHPNIVTAFDANQAGDRYYLVMEFVDGPNLHRLVREQGPPPVGQACDFVRQVAEGLQYAFEMGMVHRDVKPSNLLVSRPAGDSPGKRHMVKILDFGLARLHERGTDEHAAVGTILVTRENVLIGTPDFVSPEQARDLHAADIRSDIYSLGCTLYYLLTGQVPFPSGSSLEKLIRHTTEEPKPVEQLRPDVPPAAAAVVRRLMAKDPGARFQTPAEVAAALGPFAVDAEPSWAVPRATASADVKTPSSAGIDLGPDSSSSPDSPRTDALGALVSTVPPDSSPTMMSVVEVPWALTGSGATPADREQRRRMQIALGVAVGVVGGLLLLAGLLSGLMLGW
jgi:serine/threonine-protein kinase